MALTIKVSKQECTGNKIVADRRLYLNEEKDKLVEEGDKDAKFLYCSAGKFIIQEDAEKLGLEVKVSNPASKPKADKSKLANKADKSKPADKADKSKPANKGKVS